MLRAAGAEVPDDLAYLLTETLQNLPIAERRRITAAAAAWKRMFDPRPESQSPYFSRL